ncbi:hypothetical protein V5799_010799 [Amblyomma americanum]|uniref:Secreted protein n=1 Tax=Amblyomma americanum TaxID=6943 RepID=A0AAQ4EJ02_AMBAM
MTTTWDFCVSFFVWCCTPVFVSSSRKEYFVFSHSGSKTSLIRSRFLCSKSCTLKMSYRVTLYCSQLIRSRIV